MSFFEKLSLFCLRLALGWLFLYAGISKLIDPKWSAQGYLLGAKTFVGMYHFFALPNVVPAVSFINEWGLTLLGISLILGVFVRLSSVLGSLLMLLYYFPILQFPYPAPQSFIVDQHIIFFFLLLTFAAIRAGRVWGLERFCEKFTFCSRFPRFYSWLG